MQQLKKYLGIVWILLAVLIIVLLVYAAIINISSEGKADIHHPLPWIIIITIFTPIAFGLALFGYYALKEEYV
jgi:small-conductance mechanosensitive channel